jgi:hypothetical protein
MIYDGGLNREEWIAARNQRRLERKERLRAARGRVWDINTGPEYDGEYVSVEFTQANGERVIGRYRLTGWDLAPQAIEDRLSRVGKTFHFAGGSGPGPRPRSPGNTRRKSEMPLDPASPDPV